MQALIIAAGRGSRLWERTLQSPKTLLPFLDGTILSQIMTNLTAAGASRFRLVIGFRGLDIVHYLRDHDLAARVSCVENVEWHRGNALSVLRGGEAWVAAGDSMLLSMCDHLVTPDAVRLVITHPSPKNLLLVDRRLEAVYDLEDATKVLVDGKHIIAIGKELAEYNAVDCGIFRINVRMLAAIRANIELNRESISEAASVLIDQDDFEAVDLPAAGAWIDIDTPAAYRHALDHAKLLTYRLVSGRP
ncbi:MAG: NTP transferase domain-containing protein [Candidatus Eisenbacteria bacterium]